MSNIPMARQKLSLLRRGAEADGLSEVVVAIDEIEKLLWRESRKERVARRSRSMTPDLKRRLREHVEANPDEPMQEVANRFDVNIGRVSEALK